MGQADSTLCSSCSGGGNGAVQLENQDDSEVPPPSPFVNQAQSERPDGWSAEVMADTGPTDPPKQEEVAPLQGDLDKKAQLEKETRAAELEEAREATERQAAKALADLADRAEAERQLQQEQAEAAAVAQKEAALEEYSRLLKKTAGEMQENSAGGGFNGVNRYGSEGTFPAWTSSCIPTLALVNPSAGAGAGTDIIQVARRSGGYRERFFNIIDVVRGQRYGGLLDLFRKELGKVKDEARAMGVRPRLISGGGDGTASFALWMVFKALKADDSRADEGLKDSGNGFIWTDDEFEKYFPALAQLPLGSANDFGNILGWGQKYPGDGVCCGGAKGRFKALEKWIRHVIDPTSQVVNFDLWGLMPPKGTDTTDFKIAELVGDRGRKPHVSADGKMQLAMQEAGKPTPFFICLYFSTGFGAYMVARFQLNRRSTPVRNRLEYVRQGAGIVLERTPPQINIRAEGVSIDCDDEPYFPPRRDKGVKGKAYREVGFYNINWQAHLAHGADRAGLCTRLAGLGLCAKRPPVCFNDGLLDMYRMRFTTYIKNPGNVMQTDKKKDMALTFDGGKGKGIFFQYDGEARFAFSPTGEPFTMYVRKVLNLPVVLGPYRSKRLTEPVDNGLPVCFQFTGDSAEEQNRVKRRILKSLTDELEQELHASNDEISACSIPVRSNAH